MSGEGVSGEGWRSGVPLEELIRGVVLGGGVSGDKEGGCMRREWRAASVSTVLSELIGLQY